MNNTHVQCDSGNFTLGQKLDSINVRSSENTIELTFEDFKLTLLSDSSITGVISDLNGVPND